MPQLSKATLQELDNQNQPRAGRAAVPVQFNPSSLRLQYSNQSEGGRSPGRQARQHTGNGSVTLNVDLLFDTADEGRTDRPRSVLERTRAIESFIRPQAQAGRNQAPPRLRFQWGDLIVDGVLDTLSVDIDHFAHDGTPLRAKATLGIKGQDPERQANRRGAGANTAVGTTPAGAASALAALPGAANSALAALGQGALRTVQAVSAANLAAHTLATAQELESLAALAQRNGLPPEAWRALAGGVSDPTRLPPGREIALPPSAQAGPGVGGSQGVNSGNTAAGGTAQRVGLTPAEGASPGLATLQRGYALAAAGGLGAAIETVKADAGEQGAIRARHDFASAGGASAGLQTRPSVFSLRADPRAQAFGRGVPLRDCVVVAQDDRANLLSGQAVLKRQTSLLPPTSGDPGVPGWVALPQAPADPARARLRHTRGCRCRCGCGR